MTKAQSRAINSVVQERELVPYATRAHNARKGSEVSKGARYGMLVLTGDQYQKGYTRYFSAICDCGNVTIAGWNELRTGKTQSCGCLLVLSHIKHGKSRSRLYEIWKSMKGRCLRNKNYSHVSVCHEWDSDFEAFRKWATENGYRDDLTIDRINNRENYTPQNCRWATRQEQANNMSTNVMVEAFGATKTLSEWARDCRCVVSYGTLCKRIRAGVTATDAITCKRLARKVTRG